MNRKPDHHQRKEAAFDSTESFERSLKRGYGHDHQNHKHWENLEPAEYCNKMLCKKDVKECAKGLGCHDEKEACKDACPEEDRSCCQTCKDAFGICAANCIAAEDICMQQGHPDVDTCASCFNETDASNSALCDEVLEYKRHGTGQSDSISMDMSIDSSDSSDITALSRSSEESTDTFASNGEIVGISAIAALCIGAVVYTMKRLQKVQEQSQIFPATTRNRSQYP